MRQLHLTLLETGRIHVQYILNFKVLDEKVLRSDELAKNLVAFKLWLSR